MVPTRRGMTPSLRQSWHFTSIPETESINVQPTVILDKNMPTAKSRLSVILGKYNSFPRILEHEEGFSSSPTSFNGIREFRDMGSSMNQPPSTPSTPSLSSRPISNISNISNISSSTNPDEISDFSPSFSPFATTFNNDDNNNSNNNNNIKNNNYNYGSVASNSSTSNDYYYCNISHKQQYSTPNDLRENKEEIDLTPRPTSMPILPNSNDERYNSNVASRDDLRKIEAKEMEMEFFRNRSTAYLMSGPNRSRIRSSSLLTVRHKEKFNARLSKASMRLSLNTRMQKRLNVALEIINTERSYVDSLLLIQGV